MNTPTATPKNGHRFKVASYQRVSVETDTTGSHTFETQTQRIKEKLDAIYGVNQYDIVAFRDDGVSGAYGPEPTAMEKHVRRGLKSLVQALKTESFDTLIFYDLSRFVRSHRWFEQILEDVVLPNNVRFISATEDFDLATPEGRAFARMTSMMNGMFRDGIKKRTRDAAATRAAAGYLVGQVGYGWAWEPLGDAGVQHRRRIRPVPEEGENVIQMMEWYMAGWSLPRIAKELNKRQIASPSGKAKWSFAAVRNVLQNPVHAGHVPSRQGLQQGEHYESRYYDLESYEAMLSARAERKRWNKTNTAKTKEHLLNGLVFCARCGKRLYPLRSSDPTYRAYNCTNGDRQGERTCPAVSVRAEALERTVIGEIARLAAEPGIRALIAAEAERIARSEDEQGARRLPALRKALADLDVQFKRWADGFSQSLFTAEQFKAYNAELLAKKAALEVELAEIEKPRQIAADNATRLARIQRSMDDFPTVFAHLNMDERREVLHLLLETLTLDRPGTDAVVTVKVAMLPARTLPILVSRKKRGCHLVGAAAVTPRQMALLYHISRGKTLCEAGAEMGLQMSATYSLAHYIRTHLGIHDLNEAADMQKRRIHSLLPTLPLGPQPKRMASDDKPILSAKLMEVVALMGNGATAPEIAKLTGLSVITVNGRRQKIKEALGAETIYEAVTKARALGLVA